MKGKDINNRIEYSATDSYHPMRAGDVSQLYTTPNGLATTSLGLHPDDLCSIPLVDDSTWIELYGLIFGGNQPGVIVNCNLSNQ